MHICISFPTNKSVNDRFRHIKHGVHSFSKRPGNPTYRVVEATLDAQAASLLAREQTRLDGLVEAKLSELLEAKLDSRTAELFARKHRPAASDEILAKADSADLATRMTCAVDGSGTLGCVAEPVCGSDEVPRSTVVASRPPLSPNPTAGC